jgi:dipeptidyl aminopeptidase/acylaminoacyl peptidase
MQLAISRLTVAVPLAYAILSVALPARLSAQVDPTPSFEDLLSLERVEDARLAPDGRMIAYVVSTTDWEANRYDREIWIAPDGRAPYQLTVTADGSSTQPRWSPDGRRIGFLADRGDDTQVFLISPTGGEATAITAVDGGVEQFQWAPDGSRIAFTAGDPENDATRAREKRFGEFAVEDADSRMTHLWTVDAVPNAEPTRITGGDDFTVDDFAWSPDGEQIAFSHRPDALVESWPKSDLSIVTLASGTVTPLVQEPGPDTDPIWSPDGEWILFRGLFQDTAGYRNAELARVPGAGGEIERLTDAFDEDPNPVAWNRSGIWFTAAQRTAVHLYHLDVGSGTIVPHIAGPLVVRGVSFSSDAGTVAFLGQTDTTLAEVYRSPVARPRPVPITEMTRQIAGWPLGSSETLTWSSADGASIEGVLMTPPGYTPGAPHPLFVVIHGGPTGTSRPAPVSRSVYPVNAWLARGAVVLMPNYRGSAGYGEAFRALNVRNLGIGDAWDVLSGVQHLVDQGIADPDRLAAMGWSQGGYISAFLATTTDRFRAISVGAGISNWTTYYVNTDIHFFTRDYLKATPWDDPDIYATTSPITYVRDASTPTLIQHGEFDRRVPIPNAYELYQGLKDVGVPTSSSCTRDSATASRSHGSGWPPCSTTGTGSSATSGLRQ